MTHYTSSLNDAQHPPTLYTVASPTDPSRGYWPNGAVRKAGFGNGLTETQALNNRLQPCRMNVNAGNAYYTNCTDSTAAGTFLDFTLGYNAGSGDNGNVVSWSSIAQQVFNRSYSYDNLNRIQSMAETASGQACKGLSWTIDAWGNMTNQNITGGSCTSFQSSSPGTNNQLAVNQYDAAGNVLYNGSHHFTYDAEGRILTVDGGSTASYVYNENGQRVRKNTGGAWTEYFYAPDGNVQSEYNGSWLRHYVYAGSRLLAIYQNGTTDFVHPDQLSSTRLVTSVSKGIVDNMDYEPFGHQSTGGTVTTHKFTGKELDTESGLDYFGARYRGPIQGRFLSPDQLNLTDDRVLNPANTLNKYAYGGNNPLKYTDPDGKDITVFYEAPSISFSFPYYSPGHIIFVAENQSSGDAAAMSFGPVKDSEYGFTPTGSPVNSTTTFDSNMSPSDLRLNFASLTIQTNPEDAQKVIDFIRQLSGSTDVIPYRLGSTNCTTVCRDALKAIGLIPRDNKDWTPKGLWQTLYARYGGKFLHQEPGLTPDYDYDPFDLLHLLLNGDDSSVTSYEKYFIDCSKNPGACQNIRVPDTE